LISGRLQQKYGIYEHETPKSENHEKNIYAKMWRKNTIIKMSSHIKSLELSKVGRYDNHKKQYNSL
jgi:hypothetical protein